MIKNSEEPSNVVQFPKSKRNSPPQTNEEMMEGIVYVRKEKIDSLIDDFLGDFFGYCSSEGFDLSGDICVKETAFMIEAIQSALYKTVNITHPMQKLSDQCVSFIDIPDYPEEDQEE